MQKTETVWTPSKAPTVKMADACMSTIKISPLGSRLSPTAVSRYGTSVVQLGPTTASGKIARKELTSSESGTAQRPAGRVVMGSALVPDRRRAQHGLTDLKVRREPSGCADSNDGLHAKRGQLLDHYGGRGCVDWETGEAHLRGELQNGARRVRDLSQRPG
jgi:hypothetical protein